MKEKLLTALFCLLLASKSFSQWSSVTVSPLKPTETFQAIHAFSASTWIATGWYQSIAKTTDFGNTWTIVDSGNVSGTLWEDIDFADANLGFLVGQYSTISKTTNGGLSWQPIQTNFMPQTPMGVKCKSSSEIWIVGSSGSIIKSTDVGSTWDTVTSPTLYDLNKINFFDANYGLIVGNYGAILSTSDAGAHWQTVSTSITDNIDDLSILNSTTCVITAGTNIYKSTDKGQTWSACNVNATVEFSGLSFPTASIGFAVSDTKVFKTVDGGNNWQMQVDMGLFNQLTGVCFYDAMNGMIGGQYNTIYKTDDGGGTLNAVTDLQLDEISLFPNPVINAINIKTTNTQQQTIFIYDMNGRKVMEQKYESIVDVSGLNSGVYFIELQSETSILRRKFTKL